MSNTRRFVILFQGRTGSSYLTSMLRSHPDVHAIGEELVDHLREKRLVRVADYFSSEAANASQACGFKTKLQDIGDPTGFAHLLRDFDASVILLNRRNRVKQTISFFTGQRLFDATGDWNVYPGTRRVDGNLNVDPLLFDRKLRETEKRNKELFDYVQIIERPTLCLYYEDLARDATRFVQTVFNFLSLPNHEMTGKTRKNTNDDLRQVIENFAELFEYYRTTRYADMFTELSEHPNTSTADDLSPTGRESL